MWARDIERCILFGFEDARDAAVDVSIRYPRDATDSEKPLSNLYIKPLSKNLYIKAFRSCPRARADWRTSTSVLHVDYTSENESPCSGKHFQSFKEQRIFDLYHDSARRSESEYRRSVVCPTRQRPVVLFYLQRRRGFAASREIGLRRELERSLKCSKLAEVLPRIDRPREINPEEAL